MVQKKEDILNYFSLNFEFYNFFDGSGKFIA